VYAGVIEGRVMMPHFPSRMIVWIAATSAAATGCASPPGRGPHARVAGPAAAVRAGSPERAARAVPGHRGELDGVSCPRPAACVAVGLSLGREPGHFRPLAEAWNGTTWRVLRTAPLPAGVFGGLGDVSCPAVTRCLAVGSVSSGRAQTGIAEAWSGAGWRLLRLRYPPGTAASYLTGVSCLRRTCLLVGAYQRRLPGQPLPLAMQLRGGRVRLLRPAVPAGRTHARLDGISCAAASACMAVGAYVYPFGHNAPPGLAFAEAWDGISWRLIDVPTPDRAPDSELGRVSCPAATRCLATGSFDFLTAVSARPLTEAWQAGRWRAVAITGQRLKGLFPSGVSCWSASRCVAVGGTLGRTERPGAELWNGRTLRALPVPRPARGNLNGISCPAPSRCVAVGVARRGTLAELWNGKTWQVLPAPAITH